MTELEEKIDKILQEQAPSTFEQWVLARTDDEQDAIHQALDYAYRTQSYMPVYRGLHNLNDRPWPGGKDALINYTKRRFGA